VTARAGYWPHATDGLIAVTAIRPTTRGRYPGPGAGNIVRWDGDRRRPLGCAS
jgi:hypothetical protein